jgi:hypothetical protein
MKNHGRTGRVTFGVAATALALGTGMALAPSAGASTKAAPLSNIPCPINYSCYYPGTYFNGTPIIPNSCGKWYFGNGVLSVLNNGHGAAALYDRNGVYITTVSVGGSNWSLPRAAWSVYITC